MAWTSYKILIFWPLNSKYDLDLWHRAIGLIRNTPTHDNKQFDKVLWSYNNNFSSYGQKKAKNTHFLLLTSKYDLDFWHRAMGLIRDTPSNDTEQFDKVLWRYNNIISSFGPDKPKNAHFGHLTSKYDLDLWHRVMGLIRDKPTHDTEQFDKVLWKYNNNFSSYGPDKPKNAHFWPLNSKCDLDLWHRVMGLMRDMPIHDTEQFDKVL